MSCSPCSRLSAETLRYGVFPSESLKLQLEGERHDSRDEADLANLQCRDSCFQHRLGDYRVIHGKVGGGGWCDAKVWGRESSEYLPITDNCPALCMNINGAMLNITCDKSYVITNHQRS